MKLCGIFLQLARRCAPRFFSRAEMILPLKSAICVSVSVASRLWNATRTSSEYFPRDKCSRRKIFAASARGVPEPRGDTDGNTDRGLAANIFQREHLSRGKDR